MSNNLTVAGGRALARRQQWLCLAVLLWFGLTLSAVAQPVNNNFAAARLIVGTANTYANSTLLASPEPSEPTHAVPTGTNSVWFRWVAPSAGPVVFSTDHADTRFNTVLAVYTGNALTNLALVAANDDSLNLNSPGNLGTVTGLSSYLQFTASAGTTYYIALAGANGETGNYRLFWNMGGYAGTFQFSASVFEASEYESFRPELGVMREFSTLGARATITRQDGYSGRVKVTYRIGDTATAASGANYTTTNAVLDNSFIGDARDVYVSGTNAFVTTAGLGGWGLRVLDVSNPNLPIHLNTILLSGTPSRMVNRAGFLYIASGSAGLTVVDIRDPKNIPTPVTYLNAGNQVTDVAINAAGTLAYLTDSAAGITGGLVIFDLVNGVRLGSYFDRNNNTPIVIPAPTPLDITSVAINNDTVTVAGGHGMVFNTEFRFLLGAGGTIPAGLTVGTTYFARPPIGPSSGTVFQVGTNAALPGVVDITTVGTPVIQILRNLAIDVANDTFTTPTPHNFVNNAEIRFTGVAMPGGITAGVSYYVSVVDTDTFMVSTTPGPPVSAYNIVNITNTVFTALTILPFNSGLSPLGSAQGVALNGAETHAMLADGAGGTAVFDVTGSAPVLTGRLPTASFSAGVKGTGNIFYVADGASGVRFIDVSNPFLPNMSPAATGTAGSARNINLNAAGTIGYASTTAGVTTFSTSAPGLPLSSVNLPTGANAVYSGGTGIPYVFVASGTGGLNILATRTTGPTEVPSPLTPATSYPFSAFASYTNSVVFDDWQTSSSFLIDPLSSDSISQVRLDIIDVKLMTGESPNLLRPKISTTRNSAIMEIYDGDALINFERLRLRVAESAGNAVVRVFRGPGIPDGAQTSYHINGPRVSPGKNPSPSNNIFPLDAGSDYATPGSDFTAVSGVLTWAANVFQLDITVPIDNDTLAEFNEDFRIDLFVTGGQAGIPGFSDRCYVTIVTENQVDGEQTAGAVDPSYNRDYFNLTSPPFNPTPGANDQVHAVAVDDNQRAIYGGDFTAVNSDSTHPRLVRFTTAGDPDTTFQVGTGPNASVLAIQPSGTLTYIAGKFSSYNSQQAKGIARLTATGTLDGSFNAGVGVANPSSTPIRSMAIHTNGQHNGKVVVVGDFTSFAGQTRNRIARLTANGSLDGEFDAGTGANGPIYAVKILQGTGALGLDGCIMIAGNFTSFNGVPINRLARLLPSGALDTAFNPGSGANNTIYGLDVRTNGQVVIGGDFTIYDLLSRPRVAQINAKGSLDQSFEVGVGLDDTVYTANYDSTGRVIIGGLFRNYNFVRRAGFARLLTSGFLDTSFADVAYNHFAGLPMRYSILAEAKPFVRAMAFQTDGDILIGGSFQRVGGGNRNTDPRLILSPTSASPWRDGQDQPIATPFWQNRDDMRNRSNFARIKGGATPGPGNLSFSFSEYQVDEFSSLLFVTLSRDNTDPDDAALGDVQAEFVTQHAVPLTGTAANGVDYGTPANINPRWVSRWDAAVRMVTQARSGANNVVLGSSRVEIPIVNDSLIEGNETFAVALANPRANVTLGGLAGEGEVIPLGVALGRASSTVSIIDDDFEPSYISFSQPRYSVTENEGFATIEVSRTGSTTRAVSVDYLTTEHLGALGNPVDIETAASQGADFTGVSGRLTFDPGQTTVTFTIPITDDVVAEGDETLNLYLFNLSPGVSYGTNVVTVASVNVAADSFSMPGHGLYNDTEVKINSTGALPGGLVAGTSYYVRVVDSGTIQVALAPGDVAVDLTDTGTGTITVEALRSLSRLAIYDNDFSNGTLRFSSSTKYSVTEGSTVTITVERTGGNVGAIEVKYRTIDGTATTVDSDYVGIPASSATKLTWGNLDGAPKSFTVTANADGTVESLETFTIELYEPKRLSDGMLVNVAAATIPVEIINTDRAGLLKFATSNFSVSENGGTATITVTRTGGSAGPVSAQVFDDGGGTASTPAHYSFASPATISMAAGVTSDSFTVSIVDDIGSPVQNANRTINLRMTGFINPENVADELATLTIVDNETINEPAGSVDTTYNAQAGPDNFIHALTLQTDEKLVIGGDFTKVNGITRTRLARLDKSGQIDNSFLVGAGADGSVRAVVQQEDGRILIGGLFTNYDGSTRKRIARLNVNGTLDFTFDPGAGADNPVYAIALHRDAVYYGKVMVAGEFSTIGGIIRPYVARLDTNGVVDATFDVGSGPDGPVYAMVIQPDGKVIIGGAFTSVNLDNNYPYLARLNVDGSVDTTFSPANKLDSTVRALSLQTDGKIVVGGNFLNAGTTSRPYIARMNADGTLDTSFTPGMGGSHPVLALALQPDGKILVGGDFLRFNDVSRSRITRLNADGTPDPTINFGTAANSFVSSIVVQPSDGRIILGGGFTQFGGVARNYLVRLYGGVIDGPGRVEFNLAQFTVSETETNAVIVVRRTGGTTGDVSVLMSTADILPAGAGFATSADYTPVSLANLSFPNAETFQEVRITINNDILVEGDELLNLELSSPVGPANFGLGDQPVAQLRITDNDSLVAFKQALFNVNENAAAGSIQLQLVRTGGLNGTVVVRVTTTNGTATAGNDYTAVSALLTFQAGETNKTVTIPLVNDTVDEGNESFTAVLTYVNGDGAIQAPTTATVNILNDDFAPGVVQFSQSLYTVDENAGTVTLAVIRTNGSSGLVTVNYSTATVGDAVGGVGPAAGVDFIHTNGALAFADGERVKFITVPILADTDSTETNELFQVNLDAVTGGASLGFPNPTTVSIANNNSAIYGRFTITASPTVSETGAGLLVSVTLLDRTTPFDLVEVDYDTVGLTAVAGVDFDRAQGTLTFNNGMATEVQTFTVNIINDPLVEDDEDFQIVLSNPFPVGGPSLPVPATKNVTITSEDTLPGTIGFKQPQFQATENAGPLQIVLSRTNGHTGTVTVDVNLSDLQAKGYTAGPTTGFDFNTGTFGVTWLDGDRTDKVIPVTLINDTEVEADEGFQITLANIVNGSYAQDGGGADITTALGVIIDDELKSGSIDEVFATQANGPILGLALRPSATQGQLTVVGDFTAIDGVTRSNVAQISFDGSLYTGFDMGSLTLGGTAAVVRAVAVYTNGNNVGKLVIAGRFDSVAGVGRTNLARLNADGSVDATFNPGLGANAPVNALIIQADGNIIIGGDFNQIDTTVRNFVARVKNDGTVDTGFDPLGGANGPVNALALQSDGGILLGGDFTQFNGIPSPRLVRLASSGAMDTSFSTAIGTGFDDAVFALAIQSDLSGERILVGGAFTNFNAVPAARLTRLNIGGTVDATGFNNFGAGFDDSVFAITIQSDKKIMVGGNFTSFKGVPQNRIVRLDTTGALDTTMNFGSGPNSFVSSIAQQPDGKLIVAGGFTAFDNQVHQYIVRLNNGTNSGVGVLQFSASDFQVYENGGSVTVEVRRILGTTNSLSVDVEFVDGTAVQGVNYIVPAVTNLTFAEGETVKSLIINIPDDPGGVALSSLRTFTLRLKNAINNNTLSTADLISSEDEATVTIIDNETVVEFQNASFVVAENGVNAQIVLTRTGGSNDPVSITFETVAGTATELSDYLGVTNVVVWAANDLTPKTVLIPVNEDTLVEGIETINMQLTGFAGSVLPGAITNSVLSLLDNDFSSGVISFESATYNVIEGLPAQIVVVRTNGSSGIVSALLTVSNSTAFAGSDYLTTNILVTFANGENRKVLAVNTKDDSLQDDGEIFLVHLSNFTGGAAAGLVDAAVTIDDNDVTIGFELGAVQVAEGDTTLSLNVTRSGLLARTFIVDYATANVTAQAGLDYVQTNNVIVFGPDETNKVVVVQIKDDFVIEGPETFTVNISGANLSLLGFTQTTITIGDNDLATDLEVQVAVNNPINVGELVRYSLLVTNYGPSDISGVTLTNILPASLTLQTVSTPNVTVNGSTLIFDLPVLAKNTGYTVDIEALDTLGTVRTVQNITTIGLPVATNDLNLANNSVTNVTTIAGPRPYLAVDALALTSEIPGPANGAFDINEQVTVNVTFRNIGETSTSAAVASLEASGGVVLHAGPQTASLGALAPNATVSRSFTFTATGTNGGRLSLTFNLTDSGPVTYDPAVLNYRLGGSTSTTRTNQITINAQGDATPYPDVLLVSGLVGILDKVSLTLSNVSHSYPDDVDMVLVSPAGQAVLVMSDAGGDKILNNVTFTISDQASIDLPDNAQIVNGGSYRPRDYSVPGAGDDTFSAPAPAAPYFTSMSAFRGIDPNGQWNLFVRDDTTGDFGAISNGWSLNITTVFPANPTAGLTVTGTQTAGPLLVGADQVYTIVVTNRGPSTASSVFLTNIFSAPFTVVSAVNSVSGAATFPSGRVVLAQGSMATGAAVTNVITVRPAGAGSFTNLVTAAITGIETDSFLGDNTLVFAQIVGANADLAVGVATSPVGTVALGNNLIYNISLTNLGPSTATSVVLTNVLPTGVNYVSSSASQGVVSRSGSLVTASLGSVAANGTVQVTITVTPTAAGSLTNSVTAASAVADSNAANNVAVATTTAVTDSADLLLALTGTPDPVTQGGNITYSISVTNRGPSTATGVTVTNPLPSSVTLVSFATPYGTAANTAGAIVFNLGSVPTGTNVTMQVVVTANTIGAVNNTAYVTGNGTFDPVSGNNLATITTAVQNPSADIDLGAATLLTESLSPANGAIDPGESVTVSLELVNKGAAATANLVATLLPTGGVVTNSGPQVLNYGAVASGAAASRSFTFSANGNLGDTLSVTLQLQDGASNLGTVTFTFQLGETERVSNTSTITGVDVGASLTYPSIINISGVSGTILKATVTLSNMTHTFPDDFDILLVGPTGKKVLLVSDVGGGFAISGLNLTLDDNASSSLPDSGVIVDGVYKPSNYLNAPSDALSTNDVFEAPAPAGPYAATLAELVGTNPNGQWGLYVIDDQTGNIGSIGGWSLSLVTVSTLASSADVVITVTASPEPVSARSNLTYTVTVTNRGPNAVSGVIVSNAIPADAILQSLATLQGTIATNNSGAIIWDIGALAANAQYQAVVVMAPQTPGSFTNVTTVTHSDIELNSSNNTATTISTVNGFVLSGSSVNVTPGNVSLTLIGQPGVTYIVEASSDLVNWVVVSTQSSADGIIVINDPAGTGGGLRFYRARQQ